MAYRIVATEARRRRDILFIEFLHKNCDARVLADVTPHLRKSAQSVDKISSENPQISQIRADLLPGICDFS